ncbi:unnamed protein product, partial [Closterium sp. Naga37s-1]
APILAARKKLLEEGKAAAGEAKAKAESVAERKQAKLMEREMAHVLPEPFLGPKEKALVKIATKGVVRLFNAVSKAQKVQKQASTKDADKKTKAAFLTELRGSTATIGAVGGAAARLGGKAKPEAVMSAAAAAAEEPTWSLLADSFQLGQSNLKGWDKGDEAPMAFDPEGIAIGELDDEDDDGGGEDDDDEEDAVGDMEEEDEEDSDSGDDE